MLASAIMQKQLPVSGALDPETFTLLCCKVSAKILKKRNKTDNEGQNSFMTTTDIPITINGKGKVTKQSIASGKVIDKNSKLSVNLK